MKQASQRAQAAYLLRTLISVELRECKRYLGAYQTACIGLSVIHCILVFDLFSLGFLFFEIFIKFAARRTPWHHKARLCRSTAAKERRDESHNGVNKISQFREGMLDLLNGIIVPREVITALGELNQFSQGCDVKMFLVVQYVDDSTNIELLRRRCHHRYRVAALRGGCHHHALRVYEFHRTVSTIVNARRYEAELNFCVKVYTKTFPFGSTTFGPSRRLVVGVRARGRFERLRGGHNVVYLEANEQCAILSKYEFLLEIVLCRRILEFGKHLVE